MTSRSPMVGRAYAACLLIACAASSAAAARFLWEQPMLASEDATAARDLFPLLAAGRPDILPALPEQLALPGTLAAAVATMQRRALSEASGHQVVKACQWIDGDREARISGGYCYINSTLLYSRPSNPTLVMNIYSDTRWPACMAHTFTNAPNATFVNATYANSTAWMETTPALNQTEVDSCLSDTENVCAIFVDYMTGEVLCSAGPRDTDGTLKAKGFCEGSKLEAFYKCWDRSAAECEEDKTCTLDYVKAYFDVYPERLAFETHLHGYNPLTDKKSYQACAPKYMFEGLADPTNSTQILAAFEDAWFKSVGVYFGSTPDEETFKSYWGDCPYAQAWFIAHDGGLANKTCSTYNTPGLGVTKNTTSAGGGLQLDAEAVLGCLSSDFCMLSTTRDGNSTAIGNLTSVACGPKPQYWWFGHFYNDPSMFDAYAKCTSDTVKYDKEACEAVTQELGPYEDLLAGAEKEEDEESPSQGSVV